MKTQAMRWVVGANVVAACCFMFQGCQNPDAANQEADDATVPVVEEETVPTEEAPVVEEQEPAKPAELKDVQNTTPYTVRKRDTISHISARYGLRTRDVLAVNVGMDPNRLRVGQVIQLPGQVDLTQEKPVVTSKSTKKSAKSDAPYTGATTTYIVKSGDTLSGIAYAYGLKAAQLRDLNGLTKTMIRTGQKLKVPAEKARKNKTVAKPAPAPAPAPAPEVKPVEPPAPEAVPVAPAPEAPVAQPAAPAIAEPPAAPATPVAPAAPTRTHTVVAGEDLLVVALRWGVSPNDLKAINNLTSTEIPVGTVLIIPDDGSMQ